MDIIHRRSRHDLICAHKRSYPKRVGTGDGKSLHQAQHLAHILSQTGPWTKTNM